MSVNENHARESLSRQSERPAHGSPPAPPARPLTAHDFTSVYDGWVSEVARWVRAMGAPPSDRDDLVQEVFVVVHRRLADFDGQNLPGWLYRITAHQVRDFRRRLWIRHIFKRSSPLSESVPSHGPTPLMAFESREKQEMLERLLLKVSEPLRVAFVLFEVEGYTGEEIAAMQNTSINTVRARILRARKKLTSLLDQLGPSRE